VEWFAGGTPEARRPPLDVTSDPNLRRHALHELTITEQPDGVVEIGESSPQHLAPSGWLADVVDKVGWDEAEAKFPEVGRFSSGFGGTLEELVAGGRRGR
jgi:hypothetical protein